MVNAYGPGYDGGHPSELARLVTLIIRNLLRVVIAVSIVRWIMRIAADARAVSLEFVAGQVILAVLVSLVAFWAIERIGR